MNLDERARELRRTLDLRLFDGVARRGFRRRGRT
jgi:hypothetical protein